MSSTEAGSRKERRAVAGSSKMAVGAGNLAAAVGNMPVVLAVD